MSHQNNPYRAPDVVSIPADMSAMNVQMISRGRLIFFGIVSYFVLSNVVVRLLLGEDLQVGRLVLVGCLLIAAWRGYGWGRVVLGLIFAMGIPVNAIFIVRTFETVLPLLTFLNLINLGGTIFIFFTLLFSKSLKAYCTRKANTDAAETTLVKATLPSLPEDPTGKELFTVATFDHRAMADVCRIAIEQEGIKVFIADDHLIGGANLFLSNAVLGIKVQVSDLDARRAVEIWHQNEAAAEINKPDLYTPVDFDCEECGKAISFPGHRKGHVETCPHCGEYVDVPE